VRRGHVLDCVRRLDALDARDRDQRLQRLTVLQAERPLAALALIDRPQRHRHWRGDHPDLSFEGSERVHDGRPRTWHYPAADIALWSDLVPCSPTACSQLGHALGHEARFQNQPLGQRDTKRL
jgi:hypothetical protein